MDRRTFAVLLIAVALFAFSARAFLYHWKNIFGLDSYWFARMGKYVLINGDVPKEDPLYAWGFRHNKIEKELAMYLPAWYYKIRFGDQFDVDKWFTALKDLSSSFGVLGSLASGLAVYAVAGPFAGILAGFLAGTNPGYVYRTMAGFYEDDAVGLALYLLGVWLFLEGLRRKKKKEKAIWYTLAALTWLGVAVSWKAYELVVYTLGLFVLLYVGRLLLDETKEWIKVEKHTYAAGIAVAVSLLIWFLWRKWALSTAAKIIENVGYLTTNINGVGATVLLSLGLHPLAVIFMSLFAFYLTLFLVQREKNYLYYSLVSLLLALPFYALSASHGFYSVITLSDGREVYIGYGDAFRQVGGNVPGVDLYQMFFGTMALIFVVEVASSFIVAFLEKEKIKRSVGIEIVAVTVFVLLVGFLAYFYNGYNWVKDAVGIGNALDLRQNVVSATVVENRYGYYFWAPKYSLLALFVPFIAPFLVARSRKKEYLFLLAVFGLTLYLGWIMLKTCYYFGAPLGMAAALVTTEVYNMVKEDERWRKVAFYGILTLVLALAATGIYHTVGRIPTLLTQTEVNEALTLRPIASDWEWLKGPDYLGSFAFLENNTEQNAPIFNWWGMGHWLTFFTNHPVATDNTNAIFEADQYVARTMLSDVNTAYHRIKEKNFEYVYWLRDYVYGASSFAVYGYGFDEGRKIAREYTFYLTNPCKKVSVGNYYNCGTEQNPFFVDADIVEKAPPIFYAPLPFSLLPKIQGNLGVYKLANRLVIVSKKMNDSLLFLLWKGGNEHFQPVYISPNGYVVVYKVN